MLLNPRATLNSLDAVLTERVRQDETHGEQNLPDDTGLPYSGHVRACAQADYDTAEQEGRPTWRLILQEEVAEAFAETDPARLRAELVQVAAVAVQWIEAIDRREGRTPPRPPVPVACAGCGRFEGHLDTCEPRWRGVASAADILTMI